MKANLYFVEGVGRGWSSGEPVDLVLSYSERQAATRYMKRKHIEFSCGDEKASVSSITFARVKVKPLLTPFKRFVTYYR